MFLKCKTVATRGSRNEIGDYVLSEIDGVAYIKADSIKAIIQSVPNRTMLYLDTGNVFTAITDMETVKAAIEQSCGSDYVRSIRLT